MTLTRTGDDARRTRLRLLHSGLAGDLGLLHNDGWSRFLARLVGAAAGEEPAAYPAGHPEERLTELQQRRAGEDSQRAGGSRGH